MAGAAATALLARRATYRELASLPDWQLRDVGLRRDQLPALADELARFN